MNTFAESKNAACMSVLLIGAVLLFPIETLAGTKDAPRDDSTFYVSLNSDLPGIPMMLLPKELGVPYAEKYFTGAMGVLVNQGVVAEETDPKNMENTRYKRCGTIPGWTCDGAYKVSGTYKDGHLTVISVSDETYTYDGTPIDQGGITENGVLIKKFDPVPIVPGKVSFKSETRYECNVTSKDAFTCSFTRTFIDRPESKCVSQKKPPYAGAYGWDICAKAQYYTRPQQTRTGTARASVVPLNGMAIVAAGNDDVEIVRGDKTTVPALVGAVLKKGDSVTTGYTSTVMLDFGYATLTVTPITQLRIDEFTNKENIAKTQLYLRIGTVQARVRNVPAIRSDFSVSTPTANASIRGSEMRVSYDDKTKQTTVVALEDRAYVKGSADAQETEITENNQAAVGEDGKAGTPVPATGVAKTPGVSALSVSNAWGYGIASVLFVSVAYVVAKRLRKK